MPRKIKHMVTRYSVIVMEDLNNPGVYTLWSYDRARGWTEAVSLDAYSVRGDARQAVDLWYTKR